MVDSHHLRVFLAVAELGTTAAAAEALNFVQPNVSARIRQLEDSLGTSLFYRRNRGMALTADGRRLIPFARRIAETLQQVRRMYDDDADLAGEVSLGTTDTFAAAYLPRVIAALRSNHPNLGISISTYGSRELIDRVSRLELDGAFVELSVDDPQFESIEVREDPLTVVAARDHPYDELRNEDAAVAFPPGCAYRAAVEQWFAECGKRPSRVHELRGLDAVLACTAAGLGITAVPRAIAQASRFPIRELQVELSRRTAHVYWLTRRDSHAVSVVATVTRIVRSTFEEATV